MSEAGFTVRLSARVDQYLAGMDQAKKATKEVAGSGGRDFDQLGTKMQDVGSTLSKSVTLPLIAVGGVAVSMASSFEGAFARMQGLAGVSADEVDGLKAAVLDLAGQTAQAPQDLADGLYFLRSSGLDAGKAMDALRSSARASAAGLGSTAVIADGVSSAMNAYAKSGLSAAEATDILTGTARAGKAEPAELAGALGRVLPIASELGVTFKDVGGAIAALSLTGNDASTSATLLTNILSKMLKPSQQGADALAGVGMSADSIRQSIADKGLLATLEDLKSRLGDAGFVKFLEDAQAVQGALSLTGQNAEGVRATFDNVANSVGATDEAFAAVAETSGFKMKQAWTDVQVALIKAGDVILPIVAGVAGAFGNLVQTFTELPGPVQMIVVGLLGLVAAAGPVLMVAGTMIKNFKEVKTALTDMGPAAATAGKILGAAMGVAAIALTAYTLDAADTAKANANLKKSIEDLSTVSDADLLNTFIDTVVKGMFAEKGLKETTDELATANLEGAVRVQAMIEAHIANGTATKNEMDTIGPLKQSIIDATVARKESTVATDAAKASIDANTTSTDAAMSATDAVALADKLATGATDALKAAQEEATRKSDLFTASLQGQLDKLAELYPKELDAVQAKYDYRDAVDETALKVAALDTTLGDHKATQEDVRSATLTARDAILDQAEKFSTLDGAASGSEGAIRRQIKSLQDQRDALAPDSPLRAFLDEYIADLKNIPSNIDTFMNLHISASAVNPGAAGYQPRYGGRGASGVRTTAGSYYEVNEGGKPEMYLQGGKQYLLPGGNGEVVPFTPAASGGWTGSALTSQTAVTRTVQFTGDINNTVDLDGAFRMANFALAST